MSSKTVWIQEFLVFLGIDPNSTDIFDKVVILTLVILAAVLTNIICNTIIKSVAKPLIRRSKNQLDDILLDKKILNKLILIIPATIIFILIPLLFPENTTFSIWVHRLSSIYIIAVALYFISGILDFILELSYRNKNLRDKPLRGVFLILKIAVYFVGIIIIIGIIIDKSPVTLLAGLGASAAILSLVFKDTIVGFVSGVQLSTNNMLRIGDWITMPKYGIDGDVIDVTLNTVKVKNFDNTITTIPPTTLMNDSFQNWRGMEESGGRRIKRSINIDMNSVKFCTPEMLEKYKKINLLKNYIEEKEKILHEYNNEHDIDNSIRVNGRRQTNIGVFRAYLERYIASHPQVNQQLTHMVRQLQPTEKGIPIELYFFSAEKRWILYENIQSDVFDHVLAIIPEFDLHVFQNPSGHDLKKISGNNC
jgi:miniconductance mechanosensitive channel